MKSITLLTLLPILSIITPYRADAFAYRNSKLLPSLDNAISVGVAYISMTDKNRLDPFTNYTKQRQVMISLFYPAQPDLSRDFFQQQSKRNNRHHTTPYMPPTTAALYDSLKFPMEFPNSTYEQLSTNCERNAALQDKSTAYSLLIFSPGGGAPRFFYTTMLEDLARKGYIVVVVDHPFDALVVEFPDGRTIIGLNETLTPDEVELLVQVRAQDVSFVIDELSRRYPTKINTTHVLAFGHSMGGSTAAEATLNDTRIKGGINIDGRLFKEKSNATISKPFLQFASQFSSSNPIWHWDDGWERLCGWKLELVLNEASHLTFTDLPLIAEVFDLRGNLGEHEKETLGQVQGMRGLEVMVEYVSAFAQFVLTGKNGSLLGSDGNTEFPEVSVKRHI